MQPKYEVMTKDIRQIPEQINIRHTHFKSSMDAMLNHTEKNYTECCKHQRFLCISAWSRLKKMFFTYGTNYFNYLFLNVA